METKEAGVLFSDISDSTGLYKRHGDELAKEGITRCIGVMRRIVGQHGGRVIDQIGDEIMCTFPKLSRMAAAARELCCATNMMRLGEPPEFLRVRTGFHYGPVMFEDGKIFGDVVHTAKRMVDMAKPLQVISTEDIIQPITAKSDFFSRFVDTMMIKGSHEEVTVYELLWEQEDLTISYSGHITSESSTKAEALRIRVNGEEQVFMPENAVVTFGRTTTCDIPVRHPGVSRLHGQIEYRKGHFYLVDQSTNGTFLKTSGQDLIQIRRDELRLRGEGQISFTAKLDPKVPVMEYEVILEE